MEAGSPRSPTEERSPIHGNEVADPPDDKPSASRADYGARRAAVEAACYRLGLPSFHTRFHDPIPASSLKTLPPEIADAIHNLAAELSGESTQSIRQATHAFRRICQSLPDSEIRRWRKNIMLRWERQQFCLIRYTGEFPTGNVSINSGRSAGCQLVLLSTRDELLQKEIDYFQQHGRIMPSARRFSRPRPHQRAPKVKWRELNDLPESGDMHDWLEERDGHDPGELQETINRLADQVTPDQTAVQDAEVRQYQPFLVECLPETVSRFISACAKAIVCDPSYVALPILAAAIDKSRRLQLKPGWIVPPILWAVVVGESGTAKTPASRPVRRLIQDKQGRALQQHTEAMQQFDREHLCWEKEIAGWKRDKTTFDEPPPEPEPPSAQRFVVSDTTVEALAPLLLHNPRGLLVACDELAGWIGSFNRYAGGQGADASHWLSMHSGESIIVDRKTGHPRTIYVPRTAVCITGSIQPGVLHRALGTEHRESGMAARLLVSCPPRRPKEWSDEGIDPMLELEMGVLLDQLYDLKPETDEDGALRPEVIQLTDDARELWIEFYNAHNRQQVELTGELAAAWSKLEEYAARLALVIHCVRVVTGDEKPKSPDEVDAQSIASGVTLACWFGHEAQRVYALLSETEKQREQRELLELIRKKNGRITPSILAQSRRQYQPTSVAEEALNQLTQDGLGRWTTTKTATKPRYEFVLTEGSSTSSP